MDTSSIRAPASLVSEPTILGPMAKPQRPDVYYAWYPNQFHNPQPSYSAQQGNTLSSAYHLYQPYSPHQGSTLSSAHHLHQPPFSYPGFSPPQTFYASPSYTLPSCLVNYQQPWYNSLSSPLPKPPDMLYNGQNGSDYQQTKAKQAIPKSVPHPFAELVEKTSSLKVTGSTYVDLIVGDVASEDKKDKESSQLLLEEEDKVTDQVFDEMPLCKLSQQFQENDQMSDVEQFNNNGVVSTCHKEETMMIGSEPESEDSKPKEEEICESSELIDSKSVETLVSDNDEWSNFDKSEIKLDENICGAEESGVIKSDMKKTPSSTSLSAHVGLKTKTWRESITESDREKVIERAYKKLALETLVCSSEHEIDIGFIQYQQRESEEEAIEEFDEQCGLLVGGKEFEYDWICEQTLKEIVYDKRYGALRTLGERKQAFNEYLGQRKELEAEERRRRKKKACEEFVKMLEECEDISSFIEWSKVLNLFEDDERFKDVERLRDCEDHFDNYVVKPESKRKKKTVLANQNRSQIMENMEIRNSELHEEISNRALVCSLPNIDEYCNGEFETSTLDSIETPMQLKNLIVKELKQLADEIRRNLHYVLWKKTKNSMNPSLATTDVIYVTAEKAIEVEIAGKASHDVDDGAKQLEKKKQNPEDEFANVQGAFETLVSHDLNDHQKKLQIETGKLLAYLVKTEMNKRLKGGTYKGKKFNAVCQFLGYRGFPPLKFDCEHAYVLRHICYYLLAAGLNSYRATILILKGPDFAVVVSSKQWSLISKYRTSVRIQLSKSEMIGSLVKINRTEDDDIIKGLLIAFYTSSNKKKPEHNIICRDDDVSESQFNQVLNIEMKQIMQACRFLDATWKPKFIVIIAHKNQHTKFLYSEEPDNVPPRTIIDSKICATHALMIFISGHTGMIGTTKPTHYHVLYDLLNFPHMTFKNSCTLLSRVYKKSTTATSVVAPVCYAHLTAAKMETVMKFEEMFEKISPLELVLDDP